MNLWWSHSKKVSASWYACCGPGFKCKDEWYLYWKPWVVTNCWLLVKGIAALLRFIKKILMDILSPLSEITNYDCVHFMTTTPRGNIYLLQLQVYAVTWLTKELCFFADKRNIFGSYPPNPIGVTFELDPFQNVYMNWKNGRNVWIFL